MSVPGHRREAAARQLAAAAECGPKDFAELLLVPGVGARTVRALAMVAEVGAWRAMPLQRPGPLLARARRQGRHPFPVPIKVYDHTIEVMKSAVRTSKLGHARSSPRSNASTRRHGSSNGARLDRRSMQSFRRNGALARIWRPKHLRR